MAAGTSSPNNFQAGVAAATTTGLTVNNATAVNQAATATEQAKGGSTSHDNKPSFQQLQYIIFTGVI